jgi:hypothetical protein
MVDTAALPSSATVYEMFNPWWEQPLLMNCAEKSKAVR